jgi:hypothetical protein
MSEEIRRETRPQAAESGNAVKFVGKPPPQFYDTLKQVRDEKSISSQKDPFADMDKPKKAEVAPPSEETPRLQSKPRAVGSTQLEEILSLLREQSYVYDEIRLPSAGIFYMNGEAPTDGTLHIRPMTGEEEQILATPRYIKKGIAINMIFQRCIRETIKPDELLSVDRTYLLIWLRGISYGHKYEVEIKCPECTKNFSYTIMLNELLTHYCPDDFRPPLTDVLPKSKLKFTWHLPRGRDETLVNEYRDKRNKEYGDSAIDDSLLYRMTLMLDDIEGLRDKTELLVLLKKLHIQDVSYLRNLAIDPPFGVDTKCPVTCQHCFHDFDVELPLEAGFFFPRQKRKKEEMSETN